MPAEPAAYDSQGWLGHLSYKTRSRGVPARDQPAPQLSWKKEGRDGCLGAAALPPAAALAAHTEKRKRQKKSDPIPGPSGKIDVLSHT